MEVKVVIKEKNMIKRLESDKKIWDLLGPVMEADEVQRALSEFSSRMSNLMDFLHKNEMLVDESYEKVRKEEIWTRVVKDHMYAAMLETSINKYFTNSKTWNLATILKKLIIDEVTTDSVKTAITLFELEMLGEIQNAIFYK